MTEDKTEEVAAETTESEAPAQQADDGSKTHNKYRLIPGEEVLENGEARPSTLAFLGMYILGGLVFGVHMLFFSAQDGLNVADDANLLVKLTAKLIEFTDSETVPIGFVLLMLFITWANRMLNVSTSGKWVTTALLFTTFLPVLITIDDLVSMIAALFGAEDGAYDIIPVGYNYLWAGVAFLAAFWGLTYKYQRSFSYAVTTNAVIFQHAFLLSRSHRRILFDRISEVMVERTPMGTILGFATVTIMTDSGVGLVEESVGTSAGIAPSGGGGRSEDSATEMVRKGVWKSLFAVLSYQRTTRRVDPDPKHCFYKIRKWDNIKMMLNEMHRKHSQSNMLEDIKSALTQGSSDEA